VRYVATRSTGLGALHSDPGFSHPHTRSRWSTASSGRRTDAARSSRGRPRAARSVGEAAVFRATQPGRPILVLLYPLHASRTTVSSPVRVLPPLTLAVTKPAARFFIAHARRPCRLVRTGTGGHTILSRVFYVTSCCHYDKSGTSPRLNPRSSAAHRPA